MLLIKGFSLLFWSTKLKLFVFWVLKSQTSNLLCKKVIFMFLYRLFDPWALLKLELILLSSKFGINLVSELWLEVVFMIQKLRSYKFELKNLKKERELRIRRCQQKLQPYEKDIGRKKKWRHQRFDLNDSILEFDGKV